MTMLSTPTPEQIEDAPSIVAETTGTRDGRSGNIASDPANGDTETATDQDNTKAQAPADDTNVYDGTVATPIINQAKQEELTEKFLALIGNPRFWGNENRILRLDAALVLPEYDDPAKRMFYNAAEKELVAKEMALAIKEKRTPVMPTKEQITEQAEFKYNEKYVVKPQLKAEKEAKKKAK